MNTITLSSKSPRVPEMIRDRIPFNTYGALCATKRDVFGGGSRLHAEHRRAWERDYRNVTYVVWSYSTPIAWHTEANGWYVPDQVFSATTSARHQSKLYLIGSHWPVTARAKSVKATTFKARMWTELAGYAGAVLLSDTFGRNGTYALHKNFTRRDLDTIGAAAGQEVWVTVNARDVVIRVAPVIESVLVTA